MSETNKTDIPQSTRWTEQVPLVLCTLCVLAMPSIALIPADAIYELTDFPNYYAASNLIWSGHGSDIYNHDRVIAREDELFPKVPKGRDLPVLVPPFSLPLLLGLSIGPPEFMRLLWEACQLMAVTASLMICGRLFTLTERQQLLLTVAVALYGPFWESIRCAQVAPFLLLSLCITVSALASRREILAGIASGAFLFKPHECFHFAITQLAALKWRYILAFASFFVVACLISIVAVGPDGWHAWLNLMSGLLKDPQGTGPQMNPTVRGQLLRFSVQPEVALSVSGCAWAVFCCVSLLLGRRFKAHQGFLNISLALAVPLSLITSLHSHNYDLLLLLPCVLATYRLGTTTMPSKLARRLFLAAIVLAILPLMLPFYAIIHYGYLAHGLPVNPFFIALCVLIGLAILAIARTGLLEKKRIPDQI